MANTSQVHKVRHGAASINYVLGRNNKGHNGHEKRNELIIPYNMHRGESYVAQMQHYWDLADEKHINQALTAVFGFSKNELNPDDPNAPYLAAMTVQGFIEDLEERQLLPKGHQMFFAVQKDGKKGLVHVHAVINDVNMLTHRGIPKGVDYGPSLTKEFQNYCEKQNLFQVDYGEKTAQGYGGVSYTRTERIRREKGLPVLKDIVRERIEDALKSADNFDDFCEKLKEKGVTLEVNVPDKGKNKGKPFYKFTADKDTVPDDAKPPTNNYSYRPTSLGPKFSIDGIKTYFELRQADAQQQASQPSVLSMSEFMNQNYDYFFGKGLGSVEIQELVKESYDEYKRTGKMPEEETVSGDAPKTDTNIPEENAQMQSVISDEEEKKKKGRKATKSSVVTLEATEKMNTENTTKSMYRRGKSAEAHEASVLDDALVKAVMRKAENMPEAEHDKDREFGE